MNEEVREEWEHIAAEGGIPYMLDCMGMGMGLETKYVTFTSRLRNWSGC